MLKYEFNNYKMDISKARKELNLLDKELTKQGIEYFIVGGVLLGCFRHGGFIPWDDDIDILMEESTMRSFKEKSSDHIRQLIPHSQILRTGCNTFSYFLKMRRNSINIDIWPYHLDGSIFKTFVGDFEKKDWLPSRRAKFHDFSVSVPKNPVAILNYNYGKDWNTKIKTTKNSWFWELGSKITEKNFTPTLKIEDVLL